MYYANSLPELVPFIAYMVRPCSLAASSPGTPSKAGLSPLWVCIWLRVPQYSRRLTSPCSSCSCSLQGARVVQNQYTSGNDSFFQPDPILTYKLPVLPTTRYRLRLGFPTHLCRMEGFCQVNLYVDGKTIVEYLDLYIINPKTTAPYIMDLPGRARHRPTATALAPAPPLPALCAPAAVPLGLELRGQCLSGGHKACPARKPQAWPVAVVRVQC